jgi:peptide/nickel transport system substrate-binding protein
VAALLSGEIDVMEPVPVQDVDRLKCQRQSQGHARAGAAHHLPWHGPEARRTAVLHVKGKNPFKDKRVRQAFYQAIDIETIKSACDAQCGHARPPDGGAWHQAASTPT